MADEDLVSQVQITGLDKATADLKTYGDTGAAAFDKVAAAAGTSASSVANSGDKIASGFQKFMGLQIPKATVDSITNIGTAVKNTAASLASAGVKVGAFGVSVKTLQATTIGAIAGFAKYASSITSAARGIDDAQSDQFDIQKKILAQTNQTAGAAASYSTSVKQLNRDMAAGNITGTEYNKQLAALRISYQDQVDAQEEVQAAQVETLKQQQALSKQAAQTQAFNELARVYGTDLTQSLVTLGSAYDDVYKRAVAAFGPVLAQLVDRVTQLIAQNSTKIQAFITNAATSLQTFLTQSGGSIQEIITTVSGLGTAAVQVVTGVLIPAFKALMATLDTIATAFNAIFGTDINGKMILIIGLLLTMTGGFTALLSVVQVLVVVFGALITAFGVIPVLVGVIIAALIAMAATVDWKKFATTITDAWQSVVDFFARGATAISDAWNSLVQSVTDAWGQFTSYISSAFNSALDSLISTVSSWASKFMAYIQPIIDKLKQLAALIGATAGSDAGAAGFSGGGHVIGPGSSTSDSIPAWLSNNEFVVKAKAVRKYGVGLLRALNSGRLDLGAVGRYAAGGLVMPTQPRFGYAEGGLVQGGRSADRVLNLTIGDQTFMGLIMPDEVGSKLTTYAVARQSRSAGRKPSWVGGKK